jgi:hypothetical protein
MGRLSDQVRTTPHSTDFKNLLEDFRLSVKNSLELTRTPWKCPTDLYGPTYSVRAPPAM